MVRGARREEGSGWGTCVYLWQIHVDMWQNQYNIVKLKNKIKNNNNNKRNEVEIREIESRESVEIINEIKI